MLNLHRISGLCRRWLPNQVYFYDNILVEKINIEKFNKCKEIIIIPNEAKLTYKPSCCEYCFIDFRVRILNYTRAPIYQFIKRILNIENGDIQKGVAYYIDNNQNVVCISLKNRIFYVEKNGKNWKIFFNGSEYLKKVVLKNKATIVIGGSKENSNFTQLPRDIIFLIVNLFSKVH